MLQYGVPGQGPLPFHENLLKYPNIQNVLKYVTIPLFNPGRTNFNKNEMYHIFKLNNNFSIRKDFYSKYYFGNIEKKINTPPRIQKPLFPVTSGGYCTLDYAYNTQ